MDHDVICFVDGQTESLATVILAAALVCCTTLSTNAGVVRPLWIVQERQTTSTSITIDVSWSFLLSSFFVVRQPSLSSLLFEYKRFLVSCFVTPNRFESFQSQWHLFVHRIPVWLTIKRLLRTKHLNRKEHGCCRWSNVIVCYKRVILRVIKFGPNDLRSVNDDWPPFNNVNDNNNTTRTARLSVHYLDHPLHKFR